MKLLVCFLALSCVALAQDINGVSLGGTLDTPSIINHNPSKAVLGWVIAALDGSGNVIRYEEVINAIDLATNTTSIPAGSEFSMSQRRNRLRPSSQVASYQLDSILFMDGEVAGPDNMGKALSIYQSELDSITAQDPISSQRAPLAYSRQQRAIPRAIPAKLQPRDFGYGYGPTLNYYIGEVLLADGAAGNIYGGDLELTPYGYRDLWYGEDPPPQTGTAFNPTPTDVTWTNGVGGTAVCGMDSPYAGQGVGGYDLGYLLNCSASNYSLVSRRGSNRADGQTDRLIQTGNVYNYNNGALQNRDVQYEGCFPGDGGSIGTPVVVTSQWYGCKDPTLQ